MWHFWLINIQPARENITIKTKNMNIKGFTTTGQCDILPVFMMSLNVSLYHPTVVKNQMTTTLSTLTLWWFLFKKFFCLSLQVTQGAAETEDMRRRLEAAETELKLALQGHRGPKEAEGQTEGGSRPEEGRRAPSGGAEGETVQSQRSGRKSRRGDEFILSLCCLSLSNIQRRSGCQI